MTRDSTPVADRPGGRTLAGLLDELRWRGLLFAATPGLEARLASGRPISGYNGFDPSGPSLHVGHLVPIFGLLHLQRHGGRPVAVIGGGTGMIGDPSGRSSERNLLDRDELDANVAAIHRQLGRFLDFEGSGGAVMVDNLDWLGSMSLIEFLRDIGKHFTVPYMLAKDSVQNRLDRGLSFTEFSYMLLQAADFLHLYQGLGVELQMGGADQWGNITAGLELIRRVEGTGEGSADPAHGLCYPLLTNPSGDKFGKTAEGTAVWLDATMTTPFAFYQYWFNAADADVPGYLRFFTLLDRDATAALEAEQVARPEARPGQRHLAFDLTARVHGEDAARHAVRVSEAAFSREPIRDPAVLATLYEAVDRFEFGAEDLADGAGRFLVATGIFASNGEARRSIAGGGVTIGEARLRDWTDPVPAPVDGEWLVVRLGRRQLRVGRRR